MKIIPVIKSATASAASPTTKMQGSPRTRARHASDGGWGLPGILVIGGAALEAGLITGLIFEHLEQSWEPSRGGIPARGDSLVLDHDKLYFCENGAVRTHTSPPVLPAHADGRGISLDVYKAVLR